MVNFIKHSVGTHDFKSGPIFTLKYYNFINASFIFQTLIAGALILCRVQKNKTSWALNFHRHTMHRSSHFFYKIGIFFNGIANYNYIGTGLAVEVGFFGFSNAATYN